MYVLLTRYKDHNLTHSGVPTALNHTRTPGSTHEAVDVVDRDKMGGSSLIACLEI